MKNSKNKITPFYAFAKCIALPIFKLLYFLKSKNSVILSGRYIICANHSSLKDPLFLALTLKKRQIFFMAKAELFQNKLLAKVITALGAFPVNRGKNDINSIHTAESLLNDEKIVGIFIEGTRSKTGKLLKPKAGAAMIAYKTNTPILPVGISQKNGKIPSLFHQVAINFGNPMTPQELGLINGTSLEYRNASRKVMDEIRRLVMENTNKEA